MKNEQTAFDCLKHGNKRRRLSAAQQAAVECLEQLPGAGQLSVEQHRAPPTRHPVDIVLEDHGLLVEVDGSQHEEGSSGWGEAAGAQWQRDRQLDRSVLAAGGRLVRLHYRDEPTWQLCMQAAMDQVQQQPGASFVYYSPSYPESSRVTAPDM